MKRSAFVLDRIVRGIGFAGTALAVVAVIAPVLLTVVLSFSNDPYVQFPQETWGFDRYVELVQNPTWMQAFGLSALLALLTAVLTLVICVLALLAIYRTRLPGRRVLEGFSVVSIIIPISAFSVALYGVFAQYSLLATFSGLAIAHAVLAVPLVMLVCGATFRSIPIELELVATTLGAPRWRAWVGITLRLALPSLAGGFVMAFQTSFEEAVLVNFLGGPGLITLPKAIFDSVQFGSTPVITAIAALIVIVSSTLVAVPLASLRARR